MRILTQTVSLAPLGGLELSTLQDSIALAARGHTLDVMYGEDGVFRSRYEEAGIGLEGPFSFGFEIGSSLRDLSSFVKPARWARSWHPDIFWLNRPEHILFAQAVARWSRSPIVCHLHHVPNFRRTADLNRGVAHFIAVSNFMRDEWVKAGIKPDRISIVMNAIPSDEYPRGGLAERAAARHALGLPQDISIVLCYGRTTEEKGVGTLLEAWSTLQLGSERAMLIILGSPSGDRVPAFEHGAPARKSATVRWFPMQSEVLPFLHAADVVVFPSWLPEAFGRVVIEGMATGRPVIASRVGAVPEILSGPMTRFLVQPRNASELATRITSLLEWRQTEPDLETVCANWVRERFSFDSHITDIEKVLMRFGRSNAT
jgi:glycosyltransferase involved in cell wall biosynthesis